MPHMEELSDDRSCIEHSQAQEIQHVRDPPADGGRSQEVQGVLPQKLARQRHRVCYHRKIVVIPCESDGKSDWDGGGFFEMDWSDFDYENTVTELRVGTLINW